MKIILLLILSIIGAQCREYYYNKPSVPFYREDGKQQQYLMPYNSMTVPGSHGHNYEVSMAPSRNIFEMHLGHHQYYTQDQASNVAYNPQQHSVVPYQPPVTTYPLQQGNVYLQQPGISYHPQLGNAYPQLSGTTLTPQPSNDYQQQISYNPISASVPIVKTPNFHNGLGQSSHNGLTPSQLNLKRRPKSRILKVCYTSGRCEYLSDNQQLQRILRQSRTKLPSSLGNSQSSQSPFGSINGGNKSQRDRRLFPYSEVPIAQYPFKK